jgi:EAL domain-containing protein (putative c-di-GMP-specific phosphodiesterase class I)
VARLSGDEFAVLLTSVRFPEHGELVAEKLLSLMREPHVLEGHEINVSCSIGVAVFPDDGGDQSILLRAADDAASHAKQFRNTWRRYSSDMQRNNPTALLAFNAIRRAIDEQDLEVVYQPQICAATRDIDGVEALVRWRSPDGSMMPPADLIALAEDAGLIHGITDLVLRTAMRQLREWERLQIAHGLSLAVNVSAVEVRQGGLVPMLRRHLNETGFPAVSLEIEITESAVMLSGAATETSLVDLKALGVRLSLDDFGKGYSSLSRLQRLPFDALKIDRGFVEGIEHNADSAALVRAIVMMGHSLRLEVTAEGVETREQLTFLQSHGCDRVQGYLLSRPLNAAAMTTYLRQQKRTTTP